MFRFRGGATTVKLAGLLCTKVTYDTLSYHSHSSPIQGHDRLAFGSWYPSGSQKPLLHASSGPSSSTSSKNEQANVIIEEIPIRKNRKAPKYPIVLCHGLYGFDKLFLVPSFRHLKAAFMPQQEQQDQQPQGQEQRTEKDIEKASSSNSFYNESDDSEDSSGFFLEYWYGIQTALIANGSLTLIAKVPPYATIEVRAKALNDFITKQIRKFKKNPVLRERLYGDNPDQDSEQPIKINLIAHSMGGLDSRYLIAKLEQENYQVVSLTTISTPHRGSEVADYIINGLCGIQQQAASLGSGSDKTTEKQTKLATSSVTKERLPLVPESIYQLTTTYMKRFNKEVLNDPNVKYFSYGARFQPSWTDICRFPWQTIKEATGSDNDGLVSTESSKWGKYMGTIENADHLDLINWRNSLKQFWREKVLQRKNGFDPVELYLNIADDLAKEGF